VYEGLKSFVQQSPGDEEYPLPEGNDVSLLPDELELDSGSDCPSDAFSINSEQVRACAIDLTYEMFPGTLHRRDTRPLFHQWEKTKFLKGRPLPELSDYNSNIQRMTEFQVENHRSSLIFNDDLWRLHNLLRRLHKSVTVNRKSKRFIFQLYSRIDLSGPYLVRRGSKTKAASSMHLMHPNLRVFTSQEGFTRKQRVK